jgi:hypothetical protein
MSEQQVTTPPDVTPSLEDRLFAHTGIQTEEPAPQAQEATPAPEHVEEVVSEEPAPEDFDFELTHNGELKRIKSKDELRQLAQKGYDYEHNIVRAKDEYRKAQSMAQAVQAQQQLQPQILDALAEAKAYEGRLKQYANVDWVRETETDPIGAFQKRAQYDQIASAYSAAMQKAQGIYQHFQQAQTFVDRSRAELESNKLKDAVPEWKDDTVRQKEGREILQTMQKDYGFSPEEIQALDRMGFLYDHRMIRAFRDAWKYRQASDPKNRKSPQGLPSAKPQARGQPRSETQSLADVKRGLHQPNISTSQRKALQDEMIARKFKIK